MYYSITCLLLFLTGVLQSGTVKTGFSIEKWQHTCCSHSTEYHETPFAGFGLMENNFCQQGAVCPQPQLLYVFAYLWENLLLFWYPLRIRFYLMLYKNKEEFFILSCLAAIIFKVIVRKGACTNSGSWQTQNMLKSKRSLFFGLQEKI